MDSEYGHPYFIKANSPLKPRFVTCGQDRHNGGDVQAMVSAMCEHLLEGESNRLGEHHEKRDKGAPREFTYDRGLQCDGGYTMYTPVHHCIDGNISQCAKAYNAELPKYARNCPHDFPDWQKNECTHKLGRGWCPKVSGDCAENTCHHAYGQSFHPYEIRPKDTSSYEQRVMSCCDHPVQWKTARRKKRQDKKVTKRKPKCPREYAQTFQPEENDVNLEWRRLMLANQSNARQVDARVGCELISSTAPLLSKGTKEWFQEMLDIKARPERKRNREHESDVSLCKSGHNDWSQDWKASKLSRNVLYEMCEVGGHEKDETESADFSDGKLHKNVTKETTSSALEEVPKISNRNISRSSANTNWYRDDKADAYVEVESANIQYSNSMRYPAGTKRYISHCGAHRSGKTTNKATSRGQLQDQAREPWKCTVWDDRIPSTTAQELTWSCEMYSRTNLREHDVGMACIDHYRSYIDARKHQKAMNDFGCQENLRDDRTLKLVSSAITQTEEKCLETAAGTPANQKVKLDKISDNCAGQSSVPKQDNDHKPAKFNSPRLKKFEQKLVKSLLKPEDQTQNKTTMLVNQNIAKVERDVSNIDNLKLTSIMPPGHNTKGVHLLNPVADPSDVNTEFVPNVLAASDTRIPEIYALVGKEQAGQITGEDACRTILTNIQGPVQEAYRQENLETKENENNTSVFMDGRGEETAVISKTIQEGINKSYDNISLYENDLGEQAIKRCSRQVCQDTELCGQTTQGGKNKRTQKLFMRGGINKKEMQDYERYKEGRKKYEEELAQKECEFEIEELKFPKQVSYEPKEKENTRETFQNVTCDSLDISQLNRIRLLNETVQFVGSSGSLMNSPMSTSNQGDKDDEIKTDECFSYQEKTCYKKGTPPPGDSQDMVPCLTCSRSSSRSSRSLSSRQQNTRNKSLDRRKKESERRKHLKSVRKKSSMSPRKSSYSSRDSSSGGTYVKKGKKPSKKPRNRERKSVGNNYTSIERSSSRKVPELISRQNKLSSSGSSSSDRYNSVERDAKPKDTDRSTDEVVKRKENSLYCNILSPREDTTMPKSLRSEVKRKFKVTSPELLNWSSRETPKTFGKNYERSPNSFSYVDSGTANVKQSIKKRGVNHSKSDPFGSLNTAELNLSIIKLYTEIQKLQQQLELNRDELDTQSRSDRCVNNSPSSGSADKTLACSSRCQSLPDNTLCNSLNVTPKEMSYTTNQSASTDWTKNSKIHLREEKAKKLCQLYQKQVQMPYNTELQENGASNIMCRSDSPEKIPKKKGNARDASVNRASKSLYRKIAAPCVKSLRHPNNHTRANVRQNSPSPSNGQTHQCSSCSEDDNGDDKSLGDKKCLSTNRDRLGSSVEGLSVASNVDVKCAKAKESFRVARGKNVNAPQRDTREPNEFPNNFTEEMQKHIASQIKFPCFEDDLHLHLTSAMSDRNLTGETQRGETFNYSVMGNDDLRSARSYVCSSSWLSSSNNQTDYVDAMGDCSNLVSPDENTDAVCVRPEGQANLLTDKHIGNGNNSKLDEVETFSEYNFRHENKIPTSVTCRKLKIFGASREQTLRFYNSSVLNNGQTTSVWSGLTPSPTATIEAQGLSREESRRGEFKATQNEDVDLPLNTKAARDNTPLESRGSTSPPAQDPGGSSRWSPSKKLNIPYTVPQQRGHSSSKAKDVETSSNEDRTDINFKDTDAYRQAFAKKEYDIDPKFQENVCDPKREKCPTRYFAKPNVHRVNTESPVEKIIELLTEKPDRKTVMANPHNPATNTRTEKATRYEEGLTYRRSNSPDASKRKVFQPNESYSEFERSPRGGRYSPVSLSKFFQQNVQHIADYIQSFGENGTFDKKEVGKNIPVKNPSYDRRDHWVHPHQKNASGMSSNNVYGQCPIEEPTRRTYRENISVHNMDSGEFKRRSNAGQNFSNKQESDFGKKLFSSTPPSSSQARSNTFFADSPGIAQGLHTTSNSRIKMAHLQSEINDLFRCNEQCPFYESVQAQKNNSSLTPQSADINPHCEEFAPRSQVLLNGDNISSPNLTSVTENNNSNQGSTRPNYNNAAERPSTSYSSSSTYPSSRKSKPDKAVGAEFEPEKVLYISYKKTKSQPKPGTLNNPYVHSEMMNLDGMDSLKKLNLVGCVKEIFFKSFKPDLGVGPREQGDHACPPKPRAWPRNKPTMKPGDADKTHESGNENVNKKLEETILCEYIAGRKPKRLPGENPTRLSERKSAPKNDRNTVQPSYISSQRHGAYGDSSREARLPSAPDLPCNQAMGNPVRRHDEGHLQVNSLGDDKNSMLPCNKVKIFSQEKCCTMACTMPAQSKWKGEQYQPKTCHQVTHTPDSNKAIPHYSDAIRTGSLRSKTSVWPLSETFSDFCGERHDANKYVSVKNAYTRAQPATNEPQNEGNMSQEQSFVPTYPKQEELVSKGEGSIMSSFEKMMQDKRPCFAEHCQLHASDSKIEGAKHRNNFGQGLRHLRSNQAPLTNDNNSSNESGDDENLPPCINVPTSLMASVYQNGLDKGAKTCTDQNVQDYSTLTTPDRKVHYVNGGCIKLTNPWNDRDSSKIKDAEHLGDCEEALLNLSLDSPEHVKKCGFQRFVLENCSDILYKDNQDEPNLVKDHVSGHENAAWEDMSSRGPVCQNDGLGLDYNLIDLSLNITQDDEDIYDNGHYSAEEGDAEEKRDKDDAGENSKSCDYGAGVGESIAPGVKEEDKLVASKSLTDVLGDNGVSEEISDAADVSDDASSVSDEGSVCGSVKSSPAAGSDSCDSRSSSDSDAGSGDSSDDEKGIGEVRL